MAEVFVVTLRPILMLCKILGIISTSYYFESNGLLVKNTNSMCHLFFEFSKTVVMLIFTYYNLTRISFIDSLILYKFWTVIIASRISENWIVKLINGIIEFDQNLTSLPMYLQNHRRQFSKQYLNIIFICASVYYIAITLFLMYLYPIHRMDINVIFIYFVRISFIVDFTVIVSSYFYLQNFQNRFEILNDFWKCLPAGLLAAPGECSDYDLVTMVDNIRLLHAQLSEILKIFSLGYGKMLLGYFVFSYINMLLFFFLTFYFKFSTPSNDNPTLDMNKIMKKSVPVVYNLQNVIFSMSIVTAAARVHDKKRRIISYLRLIRISNLSIPLKNQIKMFMNQVSVFESNEITAYGIFSINLNLVTTIIILLISGIITLIQMNDHPFILRTINSTVNFYRKLNVSKH